MRYSLAFLLLLLTSVSDAGVIFHDAPTLEPSVEKVQARRGYPVRGSWWTGCGSWQHLAGGEHSGKFDRTWLSQLSNAEIQSLHSDDHEGHVKWQFVVRPVAKQMATPGTSAPVIRYQSTSRCPGGVCPK